MSSYKSEYHSLSKLAVSAVLFLAIFALMPDFAAAERTAIWAAYYGEIDGNGNLIKTTTPITAYNAIGYVCASANCATVGNSLWGGSVLSSGYSGRGNYMLSTFPTTLQSQYGYGIYFYKPGYITWEQNPGFWGTDASDPAGPYSVYITRKQTCYSPIANFQVTNAVQPNIPVVMDVQANLDATSYSAFVHHGPLSFTPSQLVSDYYSVKTKIMLKIYRDGILVHTASKDANIGFSGSVNVQFTWTPTDYGTYKAVVTTDVPDQKCISSAERQAERIFEILPAEPAKECYTILNNLATDNQFPRVGDNLHVTFTKISNYAESDMSLIPVPATVTYQIVRQVDSTVVKSGTLNLPANANAKDPVSYGFDWQTAGSSQGVYTIIITGQCSSERCAGLKNPVDQASIEVTLAAAQRFAPVLEGLPDLSLRMNAPAQIRFIDLHQYTTDRDTPLSGITYYMVSQGNTALINCRLEANRYVSCDAPYAGRYGSSLITIEANDGEFADRDSFLVTVIRTPEGPVISNVPNVLFMEGDCYTLYLDDYVTDADNAKSELVWSVTGNDIVSITIDPITHVATFCSDISVVETATFRVVDPDGLYDTDLSIVTVTKRNTAPKLSGIPDKSYCAGDGMKKRIIDLWQYASDAETPDSGLAFSITDQTDMDSAQCVIEDSRYISCLILSEGESHVTARVSDGSLFASDSFRITVNKCQFNTPPKLDDLPDQHMPINTIKLNAIDLWQYAYDAETVDSGLHFTIVSDGDSLIATCRIDSNRFVTCEASSQVGETTVIIMVSDGELSDTSDFRVTTYKPNTAPVISGLPDKSYCKDSGLKSRIIDLWQYAYDRETPDDLLIFSLQESNPSAADCSIEESRYVTCSIGSVGISSVRVTVSDGSAEDSDEFIVTVKECAPGNTAPVMKDLPDKEFCAGSGKHDKIIDLWVYAYDKETPDSGLSFTIISQSNQDIGSCQIIDDRYVSCTVTYSIGSSDIRVRVSDGSLSAEDIFMLKSKDCTPGNTAPVLKDIPDKEYCAGKNTYDKVIDLWVYAYDLETPDSGLSFTIASQSNTGIGSCSIVDNRYISCQVTDQIGQSSIVVKVSDGRLSAEDTFILKTKDCSPCNTAPVIKELPPQEFCAGSGSHARIIDLWVYAYDKESTDDKLVFSIVSESNTAIGSCRIESGRYVSCTVTDNTGTGSVKVKVSDGMLSAEGSFTLKTKDCTPDNTAPVLQDLPDKLFCAGDGRQSKMIDLWVYAYDKETADENLIFTITSDGGASLCEITSGRYVSCTVDDLPSVTLFEVTVSDGSLKATKSFSLGTRNCDNPPEPILLDPSCKEMVCGTKEIRWEANDPDGDPVTVKLEYSPDSEYRYFLIAEGLPGSGTYAWDTRRLPDQSTYMIRLTASDGKNSAYAYTECPFIVNNDKAEPEEPDDGKAEITVYRLGMEDRLMPYDTLWMRMSIENTGDRDLDDVRVSITIPDMGLRKTLGPFDLDEGRAKLLETYLDMEGADLGLYDIQIQIFNPEVRRTMYRELRIVDEGCIGTCSQD
jgi:hypothetical protein